MQLMLKYLEDEGLENTGAYYKAKLLFENKEKITKVKMIVITLLMNIIEN